MRPPAPAVLAIALALLPAAAPAEGEGERDGAFDAHMARARERAARAEAAADPGAAREALREFLAASALRPREPVPLAEAGLLALGLGDGATAARALAGLAEAAPASGAFRFLRGRMLLARGECFDAAEELREASRGDFRAREAGDLLFEATLGYGRQLVDLLQFREARRVLAEAVAMKPSHPLVPRASLDLARAHRRMEEPAEAEAVLRSCAGRFPSFGPAWVELGDLCREAERLEEAAAFAEKGIRADPGFDRGYLLRAEVRTLQGRFDEAEADFAEHGKRFPPTGESELLRGVLHLRRGEPGKALERLRRALSLEPGRIRALYLVSLCHRDLGEEEAAREAMERWRKAEEAARAHARARAEEGAATVIGNARKRAAAGKGPEGEGKGDARGE